MAFRINHNGALTDEQLRAFESTGTPSQACQFAMWGRGDRQGG